MSGLNVIDWRNPDRTHNNLPPSYFVNIICKKSTTDMVKTRVTSPQGKTSAIEMLRKQVEEWSSISNVQHFSSMVANLDSYVEDDLTVHDYMLRICLDSNGNPELFKQTIQMFLDICSSSTTEQLSEIVVDANGEYVYTEDNELVSYDSQRYRLSPQDGYVKDKNGDYVLTYGNYKKVPDFNTRYRKVKILEILKSYLDDELVLKSEMATWFYEKIKQIDRIGQKIELIIKLSVSAKPKTYSGRIIISTTDDTE